MDSARKDSRKRSLASERAYRFVRDSIYSGRFKPGQILTEDEVASIAGVSRTPVREAMRRASADGFLELEGFRRARVTIFTDEDTKDIFEIRAVLEALAAERATAHISTEEIEQLERLTDALEGVTSAEGDSMFRQFADFNNAFHRTILKASRSRQIVQAVEHLIEAPLVLHRRFEGSLIFNFERTCRHHRAIITALKAKDPKLAYAEMMAHLMSARRSLLRLL